MTATNVVAIPSDAPALSHDEARRLTDTIRKTLEVAVDLLVEAWRGRVWLALDHPTWEAYLVAEFGDLRNLRLPVESRRARVAIMRDAGMSTRAIAPTPGIGSVGTVAADLKALREAGRLDESNVRGLDDRRVAKATALELEPVELGAVEPARQLTSVDLAVAAVAGAGAKGLTCPELERRLKWRQGQASGALSTAAKRGRLVYRADLRRGSYGAYVAADL